MTIECTRCGGTGLDGEHYYRGPVEVVRRWSDCWRCGGLGRVPVVVERRFADHLKRHCGVHPVYRGGKDAV